MTGDKVRSAEAGEDDRDEDPEAHHAHADVCPLGHGQVELAPPLHLGKGETFRAARWHKMVTLNFKGLIGLLENTVNLATLSDLWGRRHGGGSHLRGLVG